MKQFKKPSANPTPTSNPNLAVTPADPVQKTKSKMVKQIQKLQQRIQNSNEDIKNTQKMLDIDMFLKQQKQKRLQHAKNINAEYQAAKKMREQKLYKKFKREDREKQGKQDNQSQTNNKNEQKQQQQKQQTHNLFQTQTLNIPVLTPISIIKTLINQQPGSDNKIVNNGVKDGHHYKPDDLSLEGLRESQRKILVDLYRNQSNKNKYDGSNDNQNIVWKNIKEVVQNQLQIQTMPGKVEQNSLIPNDADAQNILSALVLMKPEISKQTFNENDNIFMCELFSPGSQVTVFTDKQVQVREFKHKSVNLGSRSQNPNIMWPTLIQKCFTKLRLAKNMPHLSNSIIKTVYTFFGLDPQLLYISNKNIIKQNLHLVLGHLLQQASIGFLNINGYSTKSYQNRVYPLQQIREQIQKKDKQQRKIIKYKISNPWRGKLIDNQNINRFTLLQLLQIFNCLIIIRDYPQKYVCLRINTNFFSNGGISMTGTQWTKNPQYLFTITKSSLLRIIMRKSGQISTQTAKTGIYGFLLFQNKQSSNKIQNMKMDWLITKTKSNDLNQSIYDGQLSKGNYILIPYCTDISEKEYQFYVLDFIVEKEKNIEFGKARVWDYNYVDKKKSRLNNAADAKIIQSLQTTQKFQRPKIQKIQIPIQYKSKITQQILQSLNLNLYKNVTLKHFYMPGQISNLLINKSIQIEQPKLSKSNNKNKNNNNNINENIQLSEQQKAQNLQILIGYDAINDDINQGQLKDMIQHCVGCYDFDNYGLQEQGLTAVLEALSTHAQIVQLSLKNNQLNDSAITYLCYLMEKGNRSQLKSLTVSNNKFGSIGKRALQELKSTFPHMTVNY